MGNKQSTIYRKAPWALGLLLGFMVSSCGSNNGQPDMSAMPPMETDFLKLSASTSDQKNSYPGNVEGAVNVDIKAQVSGYLESIYVKEGDWVKKGQPLFKIKSEVFQEQVSNSDAALKAALANQATAQLEVDKIKPLVAGKVLSEIQLKTAEAGLQAAKAQVAQARATLGSSKINADFAVIKAPVSGYIGRIPNRIGNLVSPSDSSPLTTLSDINTVFVYFTMSEADYLSYQHQDKSTAVELEMANGEIYPIKGSIQSASGNIDKTTGSMAMKAVFENPDKLLRAGGTGRVIIHRLMKDVINIPKTSVKDIQDKYFVFKLADSNKVNMVPIEIKGANDSLYVLSSGLSLGDQIAINRIDALNDGTVVVPKTKTK